MRKKPPDFIKAAASLLRKIDEAPNRVDSWRCWDAVKARFEYKRRLYTTLSRLMEEAEEKGELDLIQIAAELKALHITTCHAETLDKHKGLVDLFLINGRNKLLNRRCPILRRIVGDETKEKLAKLRREEIIHRKITRIFTPTPTSSEDYKRFSSPTFQ